MSENLRYWIWLQNALGYGAKIKKIVDEYKSAKVIYDLGESEWRMSPYFTEHQVEKMACTDIEKSDKVIFECMNNAIKLSTLRMRLIRKGLKRYLILLPFYISTAFFPISIILFVSVWWEQEKQASMR